jgi:hypothetical protein
MPWREPHNLRLTRIDIVSQVPSESGVYAIFDGESCLLVGEAWNLKARLLQLVNLLQDATDFSVIYELCAEEERVIRKETLAGDLIRKPPSAEIPTRDLPGISFWNSISQ